MSRTQVQLELMDKLKVHADQYDRHIKATYPAIEEIYTDLEVEDDQQRVELTAVMTKAFELWASALSELKGRQQAVRDHIQQLLSNIMAIKEELSADNPAADADLQRLQVGLSKPWGMLEG